MDYTLPRGTKDILPAETPYWTHIEQTAAAIFKQYQFQEIRTPIFESEALFTRTISESDIVKKEMYTFTDKGDRQLALRPEGTAPVARAYITNHLARQAGESKLYYMGPMFRYERPQAGRYRQFHQVGVECIGSPHPFTDAEVITMSYRLFKALGLKNVKILINSVGSATCRPVIEARLTQFLATSIGQLSPHLQEKFKKTPLKLLDSKDAALQPYLSGLPDLREALSQKSRDHFNAVLTYLDYLDIPVEYTPHLVRGLDYYTETVFEVVSEDLGAQNSICGGGRYNNLIEDIGGATTPAVGFAFGMERLIMLMQKQHSTLPKTNQRIYVCALNDEYRLACVKLSETLRALGFHVVMNYATTSLNANLKRANKLAADFFLLIGDDEAANNAVTVKNLITKEQECMPADTVIPYFKENVTLLHA